MNKRGVFDLLRRYESRNVTFIEPDGSWPIIWERARGGHVWDAGGKKFFYLTAAFGFRGAGHLKTSGVKTREGRIGKLLFANGVVLLHRLKAHLAGGVH